MFALTVMLAVASVGIEMFAVTASARAMHFMLHHELLGMIGSFVLSFAMGAAFGGHGLIALTAALFSTFVMSGVYKFHVLEAIVWWRAGKPARQARYVEAKDRLVGYQTTAVNGYHKAQNFYHHARIVADVLGWVFFFWYRIPVAAGRRYQQWRDRKALSFA